MSAIHVLSDTLKGGNKLEKTSTPKGKNVSDSSENAAGVFATMLSDSMNLNADPKGQRSSLAGRELEEKQSADNPEQSIQNTNELGSMLGCVNFALPFLTQGMLQSDLPAGKEANSGNDVSQGTEEIAIANLLPNAPFVLGNDYGLTRVNFASLVPNETQASTGMAMLDSQGDNLTIPELDKYRQVIGDLLVALSGKITDTTPEGTPLNLGTNDLRQEMAQKGLQGLIEGLASGNSKGANPELNLKAANLLAALYPIFIEETGGAKVPQGVKEVLMNQLKSIGIDLESSAAAPKDTVFLTNVLQKSEGTGLQESKNLNFKETFSGEVNKVNSMKSVDLFGSKDAQTPPSSSEVGVVVNVVPLILSDGKVIAVPVWEQISNVVREQLILKQQALKQLDIQLHPADLGKIQISLRWESGQVHMQVQASEAATGQLLQNQLSDLRQNLTNQGVNCGSLQMGQGGDRQQQSQGDEAQRAFHQGNSLPNEDEDIIPVHPLSMGQDGINRINVTA